MATKRQSDLKEVTNISGGKPAVLRVPIGPRYLCIFAGIVPPAGKTAAQCIKKIRILANSKVQREYLSPDVLDFLNKINGDDFKYIENGAGNESFFTIWFAEPWRKNLATGDGLAWRSAGLSNFTVEFEISDHKNDAGAYDEVPLAINCTGDFDDSVLRGKDGKDLPVQLGVAPDGTMFGISKVFNDRLNLSSTKVTSLELDPEDYYQAIHLFDPHINKVELIVNDVPMFALRKSEANERLVKRGLKPQEDVFSMVFDQDDFISSALPIRKGDRVKVAVYSDPESGDDETTAFPRDIDVVFEKLGEPV